MNYKKHSILLSVILLVLSCWIFFYKVYVLHLPLTSSGRSTVWTVEAQIQFEAEKKPAQIRLAIPPDQANFARLDEQFVARNYGTAFLYEGDNRIAILSTRRAQNNQSLYYRAQFYVDSQHQGPTLSTRNNLPRVVFEGAQASAAETLTHEIRETSADSLSFAAGLVNALLNPDDDTVSILLNRNFSTRNIATTAQSLLWGPSPGQGPNILSRLVYGFQLTSDVETRRNIPLEIYLAIWDSTHHVWNYINPETGHSGLPHNFLVWQYDNAPLVSVQGGESPSAIFSFTQQLEPTLNIAQEAAVQSKSFLIDFSLFTLPLQSQQLYQVLIMIPLGACVVLLLRSFIGIQTFGTFMPVLIALAFRETDLLSGIALFATIVSLGLFLRFYLEHLKLLLIPRLSIVLSGVVLIMMILSILSHKLGFTYGLSIALFPMVIITMTIERMSIVWEERNPWEAIKQAFGSLICASLAYLVMVNPAAEHLLFVFPELILWVIVAMLWLGHYHGYRLSELFRFKDLVSKDL